MALSVKLGLRNTLTYLRSGSTCRPCSTIVSNISPFPELNSQLEKLYYSVLPSVVLIQSMFVAPGNSEIHGSKHVAAGICFSNTLALTSAHAVGRVAAVKNQDGGSPLYKAYIGSIAALTCAGDGERVNLTPLAVNFASGVAVLKVEGTSLPACHLKSSAAPERESILMSVGHAKDEGWSMSVANVRGVGKKTIKAKAPWPLDDELAWVEHDWLMFYRGPPPPSSMMRSRTNKVTGSVSKLSGSPWLNLYGEVVGVASWVLRDESGGFSVGYAVPVSNIMPVVDYAKMKGAEDSVVMDRWIGSEVVG